MANAHVKPYLGGSVIDPADRFETNIKEYAIGGKLITARYTVEDFHSLTSNIGTDEIKQMLIQHMANEIMNMKLVEFTKIPDIARATTTYIARCYLAPNEQVKIIRSI